MNRRLLCFPTVALVATISTLALAEDEAPAEDASELEAAPAEVEGDAAQGEEDVQSEDEEAVEDALDTGGAEVAGKQYTFVGVRYRTVIIPKFIQNAFADGGETLYAHTPGAEFVIRQDKFEYQLFAMLGFYDFANVPFKGASDPENAWELLDGDYKILYLGSDFMWSTDDFTPGLSLIYGAGAGLGFVFGDLVRTQAYPPNGTTDPYEFERCSGLNTPSPAYCDNQNEHYNGYVEPSWANGGSSPLIFPWIAGNVGLRYKFTRQVAARLDLGLMVTGAFLGMGLDFGL